MEPKNAGAGRNARMAETVREVLWKNLQTLMLRQWGKENLNRLGNEAGTGSGTPGRLKLKQQSIGIDVLAKFAEPFGVHPWQLLHADLGESRLSDDAYAIGARFDALPDGKKVAAYALIDHVLGLGLEGSTPLPS